MKLKSLIIDDEMIAVKGLQRYCHDISFIQLEGTCSSAIEAKLLVKEKQIDLVFLDIQMPGLTGLDFLRSLDLPPMAIITTAYPNYALDGFELDVIDYLVKPFSFERFLKACHKAKEYYELKNGAKNESSKDHLFIKADSKFEKIEINDVLFVEAMENYVCIYTSKRKYMTLVSLKLVGNSLPREQFIKVQRSFLVAKNKIDSIHGNMICIRDHKIPISRKWKNDVLHAILANQLLKR